jgi:hypothetical protein
LVCDDLKMKVRERGPYGLSIQLVASTNVWVGSDRSERCDCLMPMILLISMLAAPVDERCPVDWRGVAFGAAVAELAGRLDVPYILDASVTPEDLARPVRLRAEYLAGGEVFVWLARSAGLEAVRRRGAFLVARPERLPLTWRAFSPAGTEAAASARSATAQQRRIDVEWLDAPLSQVAAAVRRGFGTDLIAHPDVLAAQGLVTHEGRQMALEDICPVLAGQLDARVGLIDGVLWIRPTGAAEIVRAATGPAGGDEPGAAEQGAPTASTTDVVVDRRIQSWPDFADCLSRDDVVFDIREHPGSCYPNLAARGAVEDILEGVRLLGLIRWRRMPDAPPGRSAVAIEILLPEGE